MKMLLLSSISVLITLSCLGSYPVDYEVKSIDTISVEQLIREQIKYDNQTVVVIGYFVHEYESKSIYNSKELFLQRGEKDPYRNSLRINSIAKNCILASADEIITYKKYKKRIRQQLKKKKSTASKNNLENNTAYIGYLAYIKGVFTIEHKLFYSGLIENVTWIKILEE